jgi:hypothetical protein
VVTCARRLVALHQVSDIAIGVSMIIIVRVPGAGPALIDARASEKASDAPPPENVPLKSVP